MTITSTYFEHLFLASKKFYINRIYIDNTKCEEPSFAFHCRVKNRWCNDSRALEVAITED